MAKKSIRRKPKYVRAKEKTLRDWWDGLDAKAQKTLEYTAIIIAAVAVLIIISYYAFYQDGSLVVRNDQIVGADETWLIAKRTKGKNSEYYHLADVTPLDGYVKAEDTKITYSSTPVLKTDFTFTAVDESSPIRTIYVSPVTEKGAKAMAEDRHEYFTKFVASYNGEITGITEFDTDGGKGYWYEYHCGLTNTEDNTVEYYQYLVMYIPCAYSNASIMVSVVTRPADETGYSDVNLLLETALAQLDNIKVIK